MWAKIDSTVLLLAMLLVFFTIALFFAEWWFKSDGQFFQVVAAAFSGLAGALLTKIKVDPTNSQPTVDSGTVNGKPIPPA